VRYLDAANNESPDRDGISFPTQLFASTSPLARSNGPPPTNIIKYSEEIVCHLKGWILHQQAKEVDDRVYSTALYTRVVGQANEGCLFL